MKKILDFLTGKRPAIEHAAQSPVSVAAAGLPQDRVVAFIADWHRQWEKASAMMGRKVDFKVWHELVEQVDSAHFLDGRTCGSSGHFGSHPDFAPDTTTIDGCEIDGDLAQVFTTKTAPPMTHYNVYDLQRDAGGSWRIARIFDLLHPPAQMLIASSTLHQRMADASGDAPLIAPGEELQLDENRLFLGDRSVQTDSVSGSVTVQELGCLTVSSGALAITDFGYDLADVQPLHRSAPCGSHPVQIVHLGRRVAGVRVRFKEGATAASWKAANTVQGNGVYGVDAGNLSIFDMTALDGMSRIAYERAFQQWSGSGTPALLSLNSPNDCLITSSGYGDGAYPAFWGLAADGTIVSLYIDFLVLAEESAEGVLTSL